MKISIPKIRLANIIVWIAAILFFFVFWGIINSLTIAYPGRIIVTCINSIFCVALFCWIILYCAFMKTERKNKRLPWDSWFLYASLFFLYFGVNLSFVVALFQVQKMFIPGIFIALWLACVFARLIFNIFSKSGFFTDVEENVALFVAILFGTFIVAMYFQSNILAAFFAKVLMGCVSVLFITLMIKKFLIEQAELKSLEAIMNFIFLFLATIATSIAVIYLLFWKQGAESQDLFNSMMGVFAGILGGVLTLAGVAWTIKKADKDKQDIEREASIPIFTNLSTDFYLHLKDDASMFEVQKIILDDKRSTGKNVLYYAAFQNSDNSNFFVEGVYLNNKKMLLPIYGNSVLKNKKFILKIKVSSSLSLCTPFILVVSDRFHKKYYFEMKFKRRPLYPGEYFPVLTNYTEITSEEFKEFSQT